MRQVIAHYNPKSRLYILEYIDGIVKSLSAAPRWVRDKRTLDIWFQDRQKDRTFPEDLELEIQA